MDVPDIGSLTISDGPPPRTIPILALTLPNGSPSAVNLSLSKPKPITLRHPPQDSESLQVPILPRPRTPKRRRTSRESDIDSSSEDSASNSTSKAATPETCREVLESPMPTGDLTSLAPNSMFLPASLDTLSQYPRDLWKGYLAPSDRYLRGAVSAGNSSRSVGDDRSKTYTRKQADNAAPVPSASHIDVPNSTRPPQSSPGYTPTSRLASLTDFILATMGQSYRTRAPAKTRAPPSYGTTTRSANSPTIPDSSPSSPRSLQKSSIRPKHAFTSQSSLPPLASLATSSTMASAPPQYSTPPPWVSLLASEHAAATTVDLTEDSMQSSADANVKANMSQHIAQSESDTTGLRMDRSATNKSIGNIFAGSHTIPLLISHPRKLDLHESVTSHRVPQYPRVPSATISSEADGVFLPALCNPAILHALAAQKLEEESRPTGIEGRVSSVGDRFYCFDHEEAWGTPLVPIGHTRPLPLVLRRKKPQARSHPLRQFHAWGKLPLEVKQQILCFAFSGEPQGEKLTLLIEIEVSEYSSMVFRIQLPMTFKQLFASKTFLHEGWCAFVMCHSLLILDVLRKNNYPVKNEQSRFNLVKHSAAVLITSVSSFQLRSGRWTLYWLDKITTIMPSLRRIELTEREPILWTLSRSHSRYHSLPRPRFNWANPQMTMTRHDLTLLMDCVHRSAAMLPTSLILELLGTADSFGAFDVRQFRGVLGRFRRAARDIQLCVRYNVYCGLSLDDTLHVGAPRELLGLSIVVDFGTMYVLSFEESEAWRDEPMYQEFLKEHNKELSL